MDMASSDVVPLVKQSNPYDRVLFEYQDEDDFSSDADDTCNAQYDDDHDVIDDSNGIKRLEKVTNNHLASPEVVQPARFIIFNLAPPSQPQRGSRSSVSLPCSTTSSPRRNKVMVTQASDYKWTSQLGRSRSMTKSFLYRQHSQEIAPLSLRKHGGLIESHSSDHWSSSDPLPDDLNTPSTTYGVPCDTEIKPELSSEPNFQLAVPCDTGIDPDNSVQNKHRSAKYCCVPCRAMIRQDSSDRNLSTTCCITRSNKTQHRVNSHSHEKRANNKCGIHFSRGRKIKDDDSSEDDHRRSNKCCIPRSTRIEPAESSDDTRLSTKGCVKFPCGKGTKNKSDRSDDNNHRSTKCCIPRGSKNKPDRHSSDVDDHPHSTKRCVPCGSKNKPADRSEDDSTPKWCVPCGRYKFKSDDHREGNNNTSQFREKESFKYGSFCTFLPGLSKWKHQVPSTPGRTGTSRTSIVTPVQSDTVSRIASLEKFECGSLSSSAMPSEVADLEEEDPEEGGDSYYELPIEMITDDQVNDTTSPVKAAFFIDQSRDVKGVLKLNDSKSMSTKNSISRHVRFLTSPQPSRPCSPKKREETNGIRLGWPRRT